MASLRDAIREQQEELQGGNAWVAFWKEGRSWHSEAFHLDMERPSTRGRMAAAGNRSGRPRAIVLNGYLSENMTLDELTTSIRYHYEHRMNALPGLSQSTATAYPRRKSRKDGQPPAPQGFPFPKSRSGTGKILTLMYMTAA